MQGCTHLDVQLFDFEVPYLGSVQVCWDCRRELALRTRAWPEIPPLLSIDGGRFGYRCRKCGGDYTSTDPGTCTCRGRKQECARERKGQEAWRIFAALTIWRPKQVRA